MDKNNTCFFTGHRQIPEELYDQIYCKVSDTVKSLYKRGYRHFISGGAIGFDTLCAKAVLENSKEYDDIKLLIYVPCKGQDKYFSEQQKADYTEIIDKADEVIVLSEHYTRWCMHQRNRKMADDSSVCVAYCTKDTGGTAYTVQYAQKNGLEIISI